MDIATQITLIVFQIRQKHPELRLCQIFSSAASKAGWDNNDLFYLPDEKLLEGLELLNKKLF